MARMLRLAAAALAALTFPASALAGTLTLHPAGFGQHSYAAWKAHQGLVDSNGNDNQALYFQKMTATETNAAGVAVVKGIAGLPTSALTGLEFWRGMDGWCGAGAPRWDLTIQPSAGGPQQTFFIGCAGMAPGAHQTAPNGRDFEQRTFPGPGAYGCCVGNQLFSSFSDLPAGTITSLAIVFDEGTTYMGAPYGTGYVHLDDILVQTSSADTPTKCWTGANDNSNNSTGACPPATAGAQPSSTLPVDATVPGGVAVNPLDTDLVTALNLAYPGVSLTDWSLYPSVY